MVFSLGKLRWRETLETVLETSLELITFWLIWGFRRASSRSRSSSALVGEVALVGEEIHSARADFGGGRQSSGAHAGWGADFGRQSLGARARAGRASGRAWRIRCGAVGELRRRRGKKDGGGERLGGGGEPYRWGISRAVDRASEADERITFCFLFFFFS
jgi:hypothetical protein